MNKFDKIAKRLGKALYKHLTKNEAIYHKALTEKDRLDKELYGVKGFYSSFPRINGAVDWNNVNSADMAAFESVNKKIERLNKKIAKMEETYKFDENTIRHKFNISQNSLSSSFAA